MEPEKEELLKFTHEWDQAMESNDAERISGFMSDDWIIIGSDGITSKTGFLDWIRTGTVTHNRMDSDEMIVNIYGNTGIVVSRGTSAGTYHGNTFSLYEWSTSVFIKNDLEWKCVTTMVTPAKTSHKQDL